jgi:hypothetical protein
MDLQDMYSKPEKQKIYTTQEAADLLEVSITQLRRIARQANIEFSFVAINRARNMVFNYDAVRLMQAYWKKNRSDRTKVAKAAIKKTEPEEDEISSADHPLVKDKRFLKLSYFPDVVPNCFEEEEVE